MSSVRSYSALLKRASRRALNRLKGHSVAPFNLGAELPLPAGLSEQQVFDFVTAVRVADAPEAEMAACATRDFRRFVYTWAMVKDDQGHCLELRGNPYFTTLMLQQFAQLKVSLANYFGGLPGAVPVQRVNCVDRATGEQRQVDLPCKHFTVEND